MNLTLLSRLNLPRGCKASIRISLMLCLLMYISNIQAEPDDFGCTMTCIGHVNLSLDSDCESVVTYRAILSDPDNIAICQPNGYQAFKVSIFDEAGNDIGNRVNESHIGRTLDVQVKHWYTGNFCWGTITVEDKVGPWTACVPDVTIACTESTDPSKTGTPVWTDCSDFTTDYYDEVNTKDCPNNISAVIKRTFIATDINGYSKSCTQYISIKRANIGTVVGPVNYDGTAYPDAPALTCGASIDPEDLPGDRAFPTANGLPIDTENPYCKINVSYTDSNPLPICGNGFKIIRDWLVIDWCGGTEKRYSQIIKVGDEVDPTISCPATLTAGTNANECKGTVVLPPATVSDNCSAVTVRINTPFGQILSNGGTLNNVAIGTYEITYIATDECGNQASCKTELTVVDDDPPIAICDQRTVVSLSSETETKVNANVFDSGSYDNCAAVDFVASRGGEFGKYVSFTCDDADAGVIMVRLRVFERGNPSSFSECMVEVTVQDKNLPVLLTCPKDVTVDCDDLKDDLTVYGAPTFSDNCGFEVTPSVVRDLDNCGVGTITRKWTATDDNGSVTCTQVIYVLNSTPFDGSGITFPPNVLLEECGAEITEDIIGRPQLPVGVTCGLLNVNFVDEVFSGGSDACFKILRKWKVIDWCQYNPALDPNKGIWIHYQEIKVVDNANPELTVSSDIAFASIENNCQSAFVTIPAATATDCNPNVIITNNSPYANASGADASGTYPFGMTEVTFTANDGCGNFVFKKVKITVTDGKKPSPICLSGVVTEMGQNGEVELWASDLEASSSDNCTPADKLKMRIRVHLGSTENLTPPTTTNITLTCDVFMGSNEPNAAGVPIEFWVGDEAGNWDYCLTFIAVQDNMGACPDDVGVGGDVAGMISGKVENAKGETIDDVDLNLKSNNPAYNRFLPGINGSYIFSNLLPGMQYDVEPKKESNYVTGVSTYDVLKVTRYVLGIEQFESPYQIIAADVNGSGAVSTADILAMRRLILSLRTDFGDNQTSWNFVASDYQFADPSNPLAEDFKTNISINSLDGEVYDADFIGIKIGDVNDSAQTDLLGGSTSISKAYLTAEDRKFEAGEEIELTISATDLGDIAGMQFELAYDQDALELMDLPNSTSTNLDDSNFNINTEGSIRFSWVQAASESLDELMTISLRAKTNGSLANAINIKENTPLQAEYYASNKISGLGLRFSNAVSDELSFEAYPNPFTENTTISFELTENQEVTLRIFDISGKQIHQTNQSLIRGEQRIELSDNLFNGAGVYYVQLQHAGHSQTKKLVLAY